MGYFELLLTAISLAMDAFAVSICNGLAMKKASGKKALTFGLYFGVFQAAMPLIGYLLGAQFSAYIEHLDHWIAFGLLAFIGGKMIWEAIHPLKDAPTGAPSLSPTSMLPLAIATSIDALVMGVTFAIMQVNIVPAVSLIGVVTFALSFLGVMLGSKLGARFQSKAEFTGGVVLIVIGGRILLSHLGIIA